MNADGTDVHQISFNPSSDLRCQVLQNGRVAVHALGPRAGQRRHASLHLNPDGTDTQLLLRRSCRTTPAPWIDHAVDPPIEFMRAREMSDGRIMVLTRAAHRRRFRRQPDHHQHASTSSRTTSRCCASAGMPGPAQTPRHAQRRAHGAAAPRPAAVQLRLPAVGRLGPHPRELDAVPPARHRSIRRASCPARTRASPIRTCGRAPPLYSIWMFTPSQNTILPVMPPVEGVMVTEAVAAQPRTPLPAVILDKKPPLDRRRRPGRRRRRAAVDPQRLRHHGRRPGALTNGAATSIAQRLESDDCAYAQSPGALHPHREAGVDSGR